MWEGEHGGRNPARGWLWSDTSVCRWTDINMMMRRRRMLCPPIWSIFTIYPTQHYNTLQLTWFQNSAQATRLFSPDDAEAGQARGTGGKDSKPFSQEIRVNFFLQLWIWTYIDQKAQLEVQCIDTKQTIEKLPPPFIYYRSELLN